MNDSTHGRRRPTAWAITTVAALGSASADTWVPTERFVRNLAGARDQTGAAIAIDGARLLVGAPRIDVAAPNAGGVLILEQVGDAWVEVDVLVPDDLAAGDRFGNAIALDGDVLVVGAIFDDDAGPEAGAVHVFRRDGTRWTREAKLHAPDGAPRDHFGWVVDVSGNTIVVGAPTQGAQVFEGGAAYAFRHDGSTWSHNVTFRPTDAGDDAVPEDWFGDTVAVDGTLVLIGATRSEIGDWNGGAVHPYRREGDTWIAEAPLQSPASGAWDWFGDGVALDGDTAVVGADGARPSGTAWVYSRVGSAWVLSQALEPIGFDDDVHFGDFVAVRGDVLAVGAPLQGPPRNGGVIQMYTRQGATWVEAAIIDSALSGPEDDFGNAIAIGPDGRVAIGLRLVDRDSNTQNTGAVEVWDRVEGRHVATAPDAVGRSAPDTDVSGVPDPSSASAYALKIEGYTDRTSYAPGQSIGLHVSSPTSTFDLVIYREAGYEEEVVYAQDGIAGALQPVPDDGWRGAHWPEALRVPIGDWPTGTYAARFIDAYGKVGHHPFVIRPVEPGSTSRILFLANFFNRNAYNRWGGKSVYASEVPGDNERARRVSFRRPYQKELGRGEDWPWVYRAHAELTSMGFVLEHLTERDLHDDPCVLGHYDVVVKAGHHEYPTARVYDALQAHHDRGGHLCNLGSDGISWQTRFEEGGDSLVCFRRAAEDLDPIVDVNPCLATTRWWNEIVGRPEERLRGTRMQNFSNALGWLEQYVVQDASHWAFDGTSAENGRIFGWELAHDEQDWLTAESPKVDVLLYALKDDHAHKNITSRSLDAVATGAVFYADTAAYGFPEGNGGMVFTAGTMHGWIDGLVSTAPGAADVRRFTRNVLERMVAQPAPRDCVPPDPWCPMPVDVTGDGIVGTADLLEVLASWGPCPACPADLDVDGIVGVNDLLMILFEWTP